MTAPAIMTDHPSDQTLASFADHRLGPEERAAVIQHIANCGECSSVVETAWEYNAAEAAAAKPSVVPFIPRVPVTALAAAAAIAIAVMALSPLRDWIAAQRTGRRSTVMDAYELRDERMIKSRLSGFPYRKKVDLRGDAESAEQLADMKMESTAAELQQSNANGSWRELSALGAAQLLTAAQLKDGQAEMQAEMRDDAVRNFELALKKAGEEKPELVNDLAAAHIERARFGAPGATEAALRYAERAWALEKTPDSAFNRALAYQVANREADENRAWEDYLRLDSTSPWADEARKYLELNKDLRE